MKDPGCSGPHPVFVRRMAGWAYTATFAAMPLLSANGTLRTILVLLVLWQVLRIVTKVMAAPKNGGPTGPVSRRSKGDIRIEQVEQPRHSMEQLDVEDADFEEIKSPNDTR